MGVIFNKVPTPPVPTKEDFVSNIIKMRSAWQCKNTTRWQT